MALGALRHIDLLLIKIAVDNSVGVCASFEVFARSRLKVPEIAPR